MVEPKENLMRIRAIRGGNRAVTTKLINEAKGLLKEEVLERGRLNTITGLLEEKLKFVKELDYKITKICKVEDIATEIEEAEDLISRVLDAKRRIFEKTHEVEEVHTEAKVQSPNHVPTNTTDEESVEQQHSQETILDTSASTSNNINDSQIVSTSQPTTAESTGTVNYEHHSINISSNNVPQSTPNRSKLPKLVLTKFRGDVTQWRTFWDSFNSAIHNEKGETFSD